MKNKLFSILISIVVCSGTICSSFVVRAEENQYATGSLPIPGEDFYTLSQLFEMSDEEYFALENKNAAYFYDDIKDDYESVKQVFDIIDYGGISGKVCKSLGDGKTAYTANVTERLIESALGNIVEYEIDSPISLDIDYLMKNNLYYGDIFMVTFPEYNLYSQDTDITDKKIIEFAKCCYCVNQIINVDYQYYNSVLLPAPSEQVLTGDVNFDKAVNISDALYIVKSQLNLIELTDAQCVIADMNDDDIVDQLDTYILVDSVIESDSFESV